MKRDDIAVLITVAFFSMIAAFIISNKVFVTDKQRQQQVDMADVIRPDFPLPDKRFFNDSAINPTTNSGLQNTNQKIFSGSSR